MSRRTKSIEQTLDEFISTAPRDALVRLQSEVSAALKYRDFSTSAMVGAAIAVEVAKARKLKDTAQFPLSAKGVE